jgi:hypothetical protein
MEDLSTMSDGDTSSTEERLTRMLDILERIMPVVEKLLRHPMLSRWLK